MRGQIPVGGHVITMQGTLAFVMLDVSPANGAFFETGRQKGIQEEQGRVDHFLYEKVGPLLIVAAFLIEDLAKELKEIQPGTETKALEIQTLLARICDEMHLLFGADPGRADSVFLRRL